MLLQKTVNIIKNWFNWKVVFIWSNEEKFLKDSFDNLLTGKKIIFEAITLDTQAQNKYVERENNVLIMKTKTLRIKAKFSQYL